MFGAKSCKSDVLLTLSGEDHSSDEEELVKGETFVRRKVLFNVIIFIHYTKGGE